MIIDALEKTIQIKIVYYGPALSGKTTSLLALFNHFGKQKDVKSIESTVQRTLFFDYGTISFQNEKWKLKLHIYSTTGQDFYVVTRPITLQAIDGSFNQNTAEQSFTFRVDNTQLKAALLAPEYNVLQGRTIHIKINANKNLESAKVDFLSCTYDCCRESSYTNVYECFIPIDVELPAREYTLTASLADAVGNEVSLVGKATIEACSFKKHATIHIESQKLEDEKEVSIGGTALEDAIEQLVAQSPPHKLWAGTFDIPVDVQRISTEFGEVRTTPEKGKYMHKAVDIVNHPKSVVWAAEGGRVVIKDRYLMTGNTVVIDHGMGVQTVYSHLEDFADIDVGDTLKKGNPIGKLGKTGYATGYHLHWELRVNNMAVDPIQWTNKNF